MTRRVIALFFSHGTTLVTWKRQGLLEREAGYYRELSSQTGDAITFVTYDSPSPEFDDLTRRLKPLEVLYNRRGIHYRLFGLLAPFLHYKSLRRCALFKTNQISGAWTGLIAKLIYRKPLIVRSGFIWSRNVARQNVGALRTWAVLMLERVVLRGADLIFVATDGDREYLAQIHRITSTKITVLPNPIDTEQFRQMPDVKKEKGLVAFVGRLEPEKNLDLLVRAVLRVPEARLVLVGAGSQETSLKALAADSDRVDFRGTLPNEELPELLNRAEVFVLPSQYEGNPKALLEAMACELPVIGTDVSGIRDVIQHGVNGMLCAPDEQDISSAIRTLLADASLRDRLASQAQLFVTRHHSQESVAAREAEVIGHLIGS